jgi:YggT family protein
MRAIEFLWMTLSQLYVGAFVLRFLLQATRADFYNPFSQFIVRVTQPLLKPLRRIMPGWRGIDFAALLLIVVLQAIAVVVWLLIRGAPLVPEGIAILTLVKLIDLVLNIYFLALIIHAILSWVVQGYHPVMAVLSDLTAPILNPIRRILPTAGGIDFSPMVAILLIMFIRILLGDIFPSLRGLL